MFHFIFFMVFFASDFCVASSRCKWLILLQVAASSCKKKLQVAAASCKKLQVVDIAASGLLQLVAANVVILGVRTNTITAS